MSDLQRIHLVLAQQQSNQHPGACPRECVCAGIRPSLICVTREVLANLCQAPLRFRQVPIRSMVRKLKHVSSRELGARLNSRVASQFPRIQELLDRESLTVQVPRLSLRSTGPQGERASL